MVAEVAMNGVCPHGCRRHFLDGCEFGKLKSWQAIVNNVGTFLKLSHQDIAAEFVWKRLLEEDPTYTATRFNCGLITEEELQRVTAKVCP